MGMDIYGVNPIIHKGTKEPQRPKNLHEGASEEDVKEYFQKQQAYEDKNVGIYFRKKQATKILCLVIILNTFIRNGTTCRSNRTGRQVILSQKEM